MPKNFVNYGGGAAGCAILLAWHANMFGWYNGGFACLLPRQFIISGAHCVNCLVVSRHAPRWGASSKHMFILQRWAEKVCIVPHSGRQLREIWLREITRSASSLAVIVYRVKSAGGQKCPNVTMEVAKHLIQHSCTTPLAPFWRAGTTNSDESCYRHDNVLPLYLAVYLCSSGVGSAMQ